MGKVDILTEEILKHLGPDATWEILQQLTHQAVVATRQEGSKLFTFPLPTPVLDGTQIHAGIPYVALQLMQISNKTAYIISTEGGVVLGTSVLAEQQGDFLDIQKADELTITWYRPDPSVASVRVLEITNGRAYARTPFVSEPVSIEEGFLEQIVQKYTSRRARRADTQADSPSAKEVQALQQRVQGLETELAGLKDYILQLERQLQEAKTTQDTLKERLREAEDETKSIPASKDSIIQQPEGKVSAQVEALSFLVAALVAQGPSESEITSFAELSLGYFTLEGVVDRTREVVTVPPERAVPLQVPSTEPPLYVPAQERTLPPFDPQAEYTTHLLGNLMGFWSKPSINLYVLPEFRKTGVQPRRKISAGAGIYCFGDIVPYIDTLVRNLQSSIETQHTATEMKERIFRYFNGEQDEEWSPALWDDETRVTCRNVRLAYGISNSAVSHIINTKVPPVRPAGRKHLKKGVYRWGDIRHAFAERKGKQYILRNARTEEERRNS